jgi:hypothetical protein
MRRAQSAATIYRCAFAALGSAGRAVDRRTRACCGGIMRYAIMALSLFATFAAPAVAALPAAAAFSSTEAVSRWIATYRSKPEPSRLPAAVHALSQLAALKEPEGAGIYVGFIAGVLGANPSKAEHLIEKMLSVPAVDQWVVVRAIAYSGDPDWQRWLRKFADRMPTRRPLIDKYLEGKLPTLDEVELRRPELTIWGKMLGYAEPEAPAVTLDRSPELLDTFWGYYFATGSRRPIDRIISLLPWANERDNVDRLTMGSMAKYTLASNAARDPALLAMLKDARKTEPAAVVAVLDQAIEAADSMQTAPLRKDALAAIEELKRKGPGSKRDVSTWGLLGQGAIAVGCVAAAVAGAVVLGVPCVVGGAASGAALTLWNNQ